MFFGSRKLLGLHLPSWFLPGLGLAISLAALAWTYHDADWHVLKRDLASTSWALVPLAAVADLFVYVWQSYRWNLLLEPVQRLPLWRSVRAIYVGLFANEILPMRPGELLRPYLLARWNELPFSVVLSSVLIERVFDGIWLIAAFFAATFFVDLPRQVVEVSRILAIVVLALTILLGVVMFRKHHARAIAAGMRWSAWLTVLVDDLHAMCHSRSFYWSFLASGPYLLLQAVPIYVLMRAYKLDLPVYVALVILLLQRLGTALPQGPGNVGVLQAMTALALGLFGVDKTTAAGFSTLAWIVITAPLLLAGSVALIVTGVKFDELRHHAGRLAPVAAASESARQ